MMIGNRYLCLALSSSAIHWSVLSSAAIDVGSLPAWIYFEADSEDSDQDGAGGALLRPTEFSFVAAGSATVTRLRGQLFTKAVPRTPMTVRGPPSV